MRRAIYNSRIPHNCLKSVNRAAGSSLVFPLVVFLLLSMALWPIRARAADWSGPEQQLARKIVAVTGPGTVAIVFENRSSLGRRDADIVQNGLRAALEQAGIRFAESDLAAANVTLTLSENVSSYVWVARIRQSAAD